MNDEHSPSIDNDREGDLLRLLGKDAAPVDSEELSTLMDSILALLEQPSASRDFVNISDSSSPRPTESARQRSSTRTADQYYQNANRETGRFQMVFSIRIAVCLTAVVIGSLAWFSGGVDTPATGATLDVVFRKTAEADSLQLKISRNGDDADVWVKASGETRWQSEPTRYTIARGSKLWEVDESTNSVVTARNPWASNTRAIDLLALLGLANPSKSTLRNIRPVERVSHDGQPMNVYRFDVNRRQLNKAEDQLVDASLDRENIFVEAFVDPKNNQLHRIVAWPTGLRKRVGPPIAELRLVAFNVPIDDDRFVVAKSLTEDGRIGKVSDAQGVVTIRPVLARRWTPVCRELVLQPGDYVRTDIRGANAVLVTLTNGVKVTLGPGTLVEFRSPAELRLHSGEAQLAGMHRVKNGIKLYGGEAGTTHQVLQGKRSIFQTDKQGTLVAIRKKPKWLLGFEGSAVNESIGSLIAKVDDRNVPLTVGYHKVKVEIRDQIARTTIEESFVNKTNGRLEGVFHFPLPQDASISGFGMWIGGELVEADVVEKQRAREIYETILREKRDPGLLEWTGGNIFKARVFPIEPHSEKRIKIVYTQVLPLRSNQFRYSYALRSEMLQANPLRELSIDVLVNSQLPLAEVHSPTHAARVQKTKNSAHLEFHAEEYSPERDFELICRLGARQSDVIAIPHERGGDGYFMVQLMPPDRAGVLGETGEQQAAGGDFQRQIIPDGNSVDVLLVCDTSASMDKANRSTQSEFVGALLSSLSETDTFNIATADVNCDWLFKKSVTATKGNIQRARELLDKTISLGWTDLDRVFKTVQSIANAGTHIVYVGDGIVTAGNSSPQEFSARLRRLYDGKTNSTFHAVSTGTSYESIVLKSIASLGGGSVRQIGGEQTASVAALELLNEIAQPGLRDINVEFRGIRVAAVYPQRLPNLAAGTQQILIGRYQPLGKNQSGQIVVTAQRDGKPVKFVAQIKFDEAEKGNSFIPRLWARQHLDHLLQQGKSPLIRDQIIALSETFHIITPYTSLLVLETDADRERFGVKRRFQMRDGERFFANGRNNAMYELLQQQMRRAADWRIGLRRSILRQLSRMARSIPTVERVSSADKNGLEKRLPESEAMPGLGGYQTATIGGAFPDDFLTTSISSLKAELGVVRDTMGPTVAVDGEANERGVFDDFAAVEIDEKTRGGESLRKEEQALYDFQGPLDEAGESDFDGAYKLVEFESELSSLALTGLSDRRTATLGRLSQGFSGGGFMLQGLRRQRRAPWINGLLPGIPTVPTRPATPKTPRWPKKAIALSQSLLRQVTLRQAKGGLEFSRTYTSFDPRWKRQSGFSSSLTLWAKDRWLHSPAAGEYQTIVNWCDADRRGILTRTYGFELTRRSHTEDLESYTLGTSDYSFNSIHRSFATYTPAIELAGDDQVRLKLTSAGDGKYRRTFLIDTKRHVVLEIAHYDNDKLAFKKVFDRFVEAGGTWWAQRIRQFDSKNRLQSSTENTITWLQPEQFTKRYTTVLTNIRDGVISLATPLDSVRVAETAAAKGQATLAHRLSLLLRADSIQNWDEAFRQLEQFEKQAGGKIGATWLRLELNKAARRNEDLRQLALAEIKKLAAMEERFHDDYPIGRNLYGRALSVLQANERMELFELVKPIYDRAPKHLDSERQYAEGLINILSLVGGIKRQVQLRRKLAAARPWDVYLQKYYADSVVHVEGYDEAYKWLRAEIDRDVERPSHELDTLYTGYGNLLRRQGRFGDLVKLLDRAIKDHPHVGGLYPQYLTALVFSERSDEADATVKKWMQEGIQKSRGGHRLDDTAHHKIQAAISFALGHGYSMYSYYVPPRWLEPLQTVARAFMNHEHHFQFTSQVMHGSNFSDSDEADELRDEFWKLIDEQLATLDPYRLRVLNGFTMNGPRTQSYPVQKWAARTAAIRQLWETTDDQEKREQYAATLMTLYKRWSLDEKYLPFLRARIEKADENRKAALRNSLLDAILQVTTWQKELEEEGFSLIRQLSDSEHEGDQLTVQVPRLMKLIDTMEQKQIATKTRAFKERDHPEDIPRPEYAKKLNEIRIAARRAMAQQIARQVDRHNGALRDWLRMEQAFRDIQLGQNLKEANTFAWSLLGDAPTVEIPRIEAPTHEIRVIAFRRLLLSRAYATVALLAARRSAKPKARQRILDYCNRGIALRPDVGPDNDQRESIALAYNSQAQLWRLRKFNQLIAIDQPNLLERDLRDWIDDGEYPVMWKRSLAFLLAEQGQLELAIDLFEQVGRESMLSSRDHSMLADWYLAVDQRSKYEQAKVDVFKLMEEYRINNWIERKRRPWVDTSMTMPSELDENVLFAFRALFEKSTRPSQYIYQLKKFYTACRDFRLLRMVPDAMLGRTPQRAYDVLKRLNDELLYELRDEATADEILNRIVELRSRQDLDGSQQARLSTTDLRALDLLEALAERKSAEVLDQPGPHVTTAVAAMKRAFAREWATGEERQMAYFLHSLSVISQEPIAAEQRGELRKLFERMDLATLDGLFVADKYANVLYQYSQYDKALRTMQGAVSLFQKAHPNGWPAEANAQLNHYVTMLEGRGRHAEAETLLARLAKPATTQAQAHWFARRIDSVSISAIKAKTEVSLGAGQTLFRNLLKRLYEEIETKDHNHRYELIQLVLQAMETAKNANLFFREDLREYAFKRLPNILELQTSNYRNVIRQTVATLDRLINAYTALHFLVERAEQYPTRLSHNYENFWNQFGYRIGQLRDRAGELGSLEPRLEKLVLDELRRQLRSRYQRSSAVFYKSYSHYWSAKEDKFRQVAEEVLQERPNSGRSVYYIARYVWDGLRDPHRMRAIEIMFMAHADGLLGLSEIARLVEWLHIKGKYGPSIPLLERLIKKYPHTMRYRCQLITAYHHEQRFEQRDLAWKATERSFRRDGRWAETNVAQLARCAKTCQLNTQAISLFREVIALRRRSTGNFGNRDSTLTGYFRDLAAAYIRVNDTVNAVDVASAAIVSWPSNHQQRKKCLEQLKAALESSKDLAAFVAHRDKVLKAAGQGSPVIRRTIGQIYMARGRMPDAIAQFKIALELQPYDLEVHRRLIEAYTQSKRPQLAIQQLLALVNIERHNLDLFKDLAKRFQGNELQAERAATTIVESAPNEAANHVALAELRQSQHRWPEAIAHWKLAAELRALEPNNLIKLGQAQAHEKDWTGLSTTVRRLREKRWPSRFSVENDIRSLEKQLKAGM